MESNCSVRKLAAGVHHGSVNALKKVGALAIIDTKYPHSLRTPLHAHERACFSLILSGGYVEHFNRFSFSCGHGTIAFRPAGEIHRDELGPSGARCLILELPG
jgi:hypothetical protein